MTRVGTSRRGLLSVGMGTALIGACATAPAPTRASTPGLDLTDQTVRLRAYMLMRGALDDQLVVGCVSGRYYGVVGDEVRPLYGVVSATFAKFRGDGAGGFVGASYEVPFFTDPETGEVMDRWHNPYTDEIVDVPYSAYPPARIAIAPDLRLTLPSPPPGLAMDHHVLPAQTVGDDVWMVEETFSTFNIPGALAPVRYSEILTLHASKSDLVRPGATRVPTQTAFQAIVSWRPWQKMGARPGHLIATGAGLYGARIEDLPTPLLRGIRARKPEVLADPSAPLATLMA